MARGKRKNKRTSKKVNKLVSKCSFCEKYCKEGNMATPCCTMECPYT